MISMLYPMHRTKKQRTAGKKKAADMHLPPAAFMKDGFH